MPRYEVTSDRLADAKRGDVVELDPAAVDIPALIAGGHAKPVAEKTKGARGGDVRS